MTPLTTDTATINSQLEALTTDIMPSPGSNAGIAIERAVDLLRQAALAHCLEQGDASADRDVEAFNTTVHGQTGHDVAGLPGQTTQPPAFRPQNQGQSTAQVTSIERGLCLPCQAHAMEPKLLQIPQAAR